jgi:hypothetical protein
MQVDKYTEYIYIGRAIFVGGIIMLFENVKYSKHVGTIMIMVGFLLMLYYQRQLNYKNRIEKIMSDFNEKLIKFFDENEKYLYKKEKQPPKEKEISIIKTFQKKYEINNNIINESNIDNIINYNINENKITLFLDIYMFVINMKNIIDMKIEINNVHNNLLIDYYKYYNNVISYISNLNNEIEISIALSYLIDDYNDNAKNLNIIFNYNGKYVIKYILQELINIINENVIVKFNRFSALYNKN